MASPTTSKTQIANLALTYLGVPNIDNLDNPDSEQARKAAQFYPQCLDTVLGDGYWNFAMKRETLSPDPDPPEYEWDFRYKLPEDYLRLEKFNGWPAERPLNNYQIERGFLLTNVDEYIEILYTFRNETVEDYSTMFVRALALCLAIDICRSTNGSQELMERLTGFYTMELDKAKYNDAVQNRHLQRGIPGAIADSRLIVRRKTSSLG